MQGFKMKNVEIEKCENMKGEQVETLIILKGGRENYYIGLHRIT